jgi:hypothetical protein
VCGVRWGEPYLKTPSGQEVVCGGLCDGWTWRCLSKYVCDGLSLQPSCRTVEGRVGGN